MSRLRVTVGVYTDRWVALLVVSVRLGSKTMFSGYWWADYVVGSNFLTKGRGSGVMRF